MKMTIFSKLTPECSSSSDDLLDHLAGDIGQAEVAACVAVGQAFVIDPDGYRLEAYCSAEA